MAAPSSAFEVRRRAQQTVRLFATLGLGYRGVQIMALLHAHHEICGRSLSYREICAETGISTKGEVSEIAARLERRGLVVREGSGRVPRLRLVQFPVAVKALTIAA